MRTSCAKLALTAILFAGFACAQHMYMLEHWQSAQRKLPAGHTVQQDGERRYTFWWTESSNNQSWYWVNMSYNSGYVDRVQIQPRAAGQGPDYALAALFLPPGYNIGGASWSGKYATNTGMQVEWWIWNVNGNWLHLDSLNNNGYRWLVWSIRPTWMGLPPNQVTQAPAQMPSMQAGYWDGNDRVRYYVVLFGDGYWRGFASGREVRIGNETFLFHRDPDPGQARQGTLAFRGSWVDSFGGRTTASFWMTQAGRLNMQASDVEVVRMEFTLAARVQ